MDGETNGSQEATQGTENQAQQEQEQEGTQGIQEVTGSNSGTDREKQIADRDARIAELEGQMAKAAKNAETAESLRGEIAELKAQGESDRIDFKLQLDGMRNVKVARASSGTTIMRRKSSSPRSRSRNTQRNL